MGDVNRIQTVFPASGVDLRFIEYSHFLLMISFKAQTV